jgi:hypothetical protein
MQTYLKCKNRRQHDPNSGVRQSVETNTKIKQMLDVVDMDSLRYYFQDKGCKKVTQLWWWTNWKYQMELLFKWNTITKSYSDWNKNEVGSA